LIRAGARGIVTVLLALVLGAPPALAQGVPAQPQLLENGEYGTTLINRIRSAQRRILCVFYLFKLTDSPRNQPRAVADALIAAQRRGVDVTVILESGRQVERDNRAALRLFALGGVRVVVAPAGSTTHAKAVSIDDRYLFIGSHNLTQSALTRNNELTLLLDSPSLAAQLRRYAERLKGTQQRSPVRTGNRPISRYQ
jgi:phosphatidylserine/phosphatidylglycerophosphate/cardiolipin synthase-like enzyme